MPNQDEIDQPIQRLQAHRRTLAVLLRQRASLGADYAPPGIANGIEEARAEIRRLKEVLRSWNVSVEDLPDDEPSVTADFTTTPPRPRRHDLAW